MLRDFIEESITVIKCILYKLLFLIAIVSIVVVCAWNDANKETSAIESRVLIRQSSFIITDIRDDNNKKIIDVSSNEFGNLEFESKDISKYYSKGDYVTLKVYKQDSIYTVSF